MDSDAFEAQVSGISALDHPISRRAYGHVRDHGWASRDSTADALDVPRSVAAFHLDKLTDAGLLVTRFERTSGRTGPGAGRPAKLYGRSDVEIDVSLPPRRYDLAATLLADAVARSAADSRPIGETVTPVATETGRAAGAEIAGARSAAARRAGILAVLERHGYEPRDSTRQIVLMNCPFHSLAERHRTLVCGMNVAFLSGVIEGAKSADRLTADLAPEPGYCCVRINARNSKK